MNNSGKGIHMKIPGRFTILTFLLGVLYSIPSVRTKYFTKDVTRMGTLAEKKKKKIKSMVDETMKNAKEGRMGRKIYRNREKKLPEGGDYRSFNLNPRSEAKKATPTAGIDRRDGRYSRDCEKIPEGDEIKMYDKDNSYKNVIFPENLNSFLCALENSGRVLFVSFDGESFGNGDYLPGEFLGRLGAPSSLHDTFDELEQYLNDPVLLGSGSGSEYDFIYIYISDIDKILPAKADGYFRAMFFDMLCSLKNDRVFFVFDKSQRDYFLSQLDSYRKYRSRFAKNTEQHGQILFIESARDLALARDIFFTVMEGKRCGGLDAFYSEISDRMQFPRYFGRNLDALEEYINDFEWMRYDNLDYELLFLYFKNVQSILPENDYERSAFFDILNSIYNRRVFILIDRKDRDFVLSEAARYQREREERMEKAREREAEEPETR
ncbi:MAG: barstar family protein [Rickettsiales bacterium]|jgi:hypothetical protein|nr:barstar family protein [Rickettsiales bacterium]